MKIRHILLILLSLPMLAAGLYTYTGPGDRTVTTTACHVLLKECIWNVEKVRYNYRVMDGWSCSNESAPWLAWPDSGPSCSASTEGVKYWERVPDDPAGSSTYPPASLKASSTCDSPGNAGWCLGGAGVTFSVNEPIPGETISRVEGTVNSGALKTFCNVNAASGSCAWNPADGSSALSAWAVSTWGDTSLKASLVTKLDPVAPAIAVPLSPNGANGWYRSAPTLTLSASDATSGLASAQFDTGSNTFTPPGDGVYDLSATALDVAGNSASTTVTVKLDGTNPNLSVAADTPDGANGWYKTRPTLTLSASDATSGLDFAKFDLGGSDKFTPAADGVYALVAVAQDLAGNSATKNTTIKVDSTDPALSLPMLPDGANGWYITPATLTLSASDATSGLASSGLDTGGNSLTISADGLRTISASAEDNAGNATSLSVTVKKDSLAPTLAIPTAPDGDNGWYTSLPTITLSASDATSGLDFAKFSASGSDKFTPAADGVYALAASAQDMAGNTTSNTATLKVDSTKPTVTGLYGETPNINGWINRSVALTSIATYMINVSDATSGIASVQLTNNPGNATVQVMSGGSQYNLKFSTDGIFPTTATVTDNAGNTSTLNFTVKRDISAPNATYSPNPNSRGWYTSLPTLRITVSDAMSGPGSSYFMDNLGAPLGSTFTPPGDGKFGKLRIHAEDLAGNPSASATLDINVDTVPPSLSVLPAPDGSNGWYRTSPITFSLSSSDATSGPWNATFSNSFPQTTVSANGFTTLRATATDFASNSTNLTYIVKMDNLAPSLSIPISPNGLNGWYKTTPTITLSASDATSGLASALFDTGSNSFTPAADGSYDLSATALDVAGNSATKSATLKVDATAPSLSVPFAPDGANGWYKTAPTFTLSASDATSGLDYAKFDDTGADTYSPPGDGLFTLAAGAGDLAGNTTRFNAALKVDTTAPEVTIPTAPDGENGWYTSLPTITLAASDATSGLESAAFSDGSTSMTLTDGSYTLEASAKDRAGNTRTVSATVLVDTVPPELALSVNSQPVLNGWHNAPVETTASASDSTSGLAVVEYQVNGGAWASGPAAKTVQDGVNLVSFRARDRAGNHVLASRTLKVDTTPPQTVFTGPSNLANVSETATFSGRTSDAASGVSSVSYSLDGGRTWQPLQPGDWSFQWNSNAVSDGPFELQVRATDQVGNSAVQVIRVNVSNRPPLVSLQESWQAWEAGELSVRPRNDIPLGRITLTVSCAPFHPDAVRTLDPGNLPDAFQWDLRCGDGAYASFANEFQATLTACDIFGRCASASGKIILPEIQVTATAIATATARPTATATRTPAPSPTATALVIVPTPVVQEPAPEALELPWGWFSVVVIGLYLVFGANSLVDPRPAAIRRLRKTWQELGRDG